MRTGVRLIDSVGGVGFMSICPHGSFPAVISVRNEIASNWGKFGPAMRRMWESQPAIVYLLLFYVAYTVAGGLARKMQIIPGHTTAFWPPAGLFVATLLSTRRETWGWWVLFGCLAEMTCNALWFRNNAAAALGFYVANALEALTAAWLLKKFVADPFRLESTRDVAAFVILGAGLATVVGATVGSASHALFGTKSFASVWLLWWLGDAAGLLISGPLALSVLQLWQSRADIDRWRAIEAFALALILIVGGVLLSRGSLLTAYILMPPLLWLALRFQLRGAAAGLALMTLIIASNTIGGKGEFSGQPEVMLQRVLELKTFLSIAAISTLLVGALSQMHRKALSAVEKTNANLEQLVAERTASLEASETRLRAIGDNLPGTAVFRYARDTDGRRYILYASAGLEQLNSIGVADVLGGTQALPCLSDTDHHRKLLAEEEKSARDLSDLDLDIPVRWHDGRMRWVRLRSRPRRESTGRVIWDGVQIDITERKQLEEQLKLLMHEVNHRAKNILSLVQAIARQTVAAEPKEFAAQFGQRLQAVAANLDLLVQSSWSGVEMKELATAQLAPFKDLVGTRILISGPYARLTSSAAQAVGLALHELSTNASKYGALSNDRGSVEITWKLEHEFFAIKWAEQDGPVVSPPTRKGFGSTVIASMAKMSVEGQVALDYAPGGVVWELTCPAENAIEPQ